MKIFYPLLCYYPSEAGGPANTIYWLNKSLGKNNYKSIILSTNYGLKNYPTDLYDLYSRFNINAEFTNGSLLSFVNKRQIRKIKEADVIHFSSLFFKPTLFYLVLCLFFKKKRIISPRGELYKAALSRKSLKKKLYIKTVSFFQKSIVFHSTNPKETKQIKSYFPKAKKVIEIPNYIELPQKLEIKTKNQILFLGRINPIKNIHLLIEAYFQLSEAIKSKFKLIITGEALLAYEKEYFSLLKEKVNQLNLNDNIVFMGGVFGKDKEVLLAESYCTILPSQSENFGNVVLESLCQGTPAIVSQNAPWKLLTDNNAGYWVEPTISTLKSAINDMVSLNNENYNQKRLDAYKLAVNNFDISKNIGQWIELYNY